MKVLIVLDHMPLIPAFMQSNLQYAKDVFDACYYINTRKPSNGVVAEEYGVIICNPSSFQSKIDLVKGLFALMKPDVVSQIIKCISKKGLKTQYLRSLLAWMAADCKTRPIAEQIIRKHTNDEITLLSTWLGACSYTNAKLKEKYSFIKSVSLAHSYEVLVSRDGFIPYYFIDYRHKHLDGVYFISKKIRECYFDGVGQLKQEYKDKTHVCYLGTYKVHDVLNKKNDQHSFHICTCSRMVPLKRIHLLIDALKKWKVCKICWTHIGDGPLYDTLFKEAKEVIKENNLVDIHFMGRMSNNEVKQFYEDNPIDLFINLSSIEGIPVSIMEAISYGIPVIATDVGGTSEIVTKETGFLIPADINYEDVIASLLNYYNLSDIQKGNLRLAAYDFWKVHFDAKSNLKSFYQSVDSIKTNS